MFTDPKNLKKMVSLIILSILVFSKMAAVGYLGFGPVQKKMTMSGNSTQIFLKAIIM